MIGQVLHIVYFTFKKEIISNVFLNDYTVKLPIKKSCKMSKLSLH